MLNWLKDLWRPAGRARTFVRPLALRGRYDAASDSPEMRRHWAQADGLSANAAATPEVRRRLRNRARYEVTNNSFAKGMVSTLANDCIGTGPKLQLHMADKAANEFVEREFAQWAKAVNLPEKLRTMRMAKVEDGESFALLSLNPALQTRVTLDVRLVEAEQVTTPFLAPMAQNAVDGIVFDAFGNPSEYHVLKNHPGDPKGQPWEYDTVPARSVLHYFRADRPGQARGVPEITSALPLFAHLRRYTLAVILSAETAANFAAVLKTTAPANGEAAEVEPNAVIELERNSLTAVPEGWDIAQVKAEQPTTTFAEFFDKMVNWIARCLNMPFNIAACDSSKYNYASGRLDHQTYDLSIRVERSVIESVVLDRLLDVWLAEAVRIDGYLPQPARLASERFEHEWAWDSREHVDPVKEATAQEIRLRAGLTTLARENARQGTDWQKQLPQRVKEQRERVEEYERELGMTREQALRVVFPELAAVSASVPASQPEAAHEDA